MVLHPTNLQRRTEGSREASAVATPILPDQNLSKTLSSAESIGSASASQRWRGTRRSSPEVHRDPKLQRGAFPAPARRLRRQIKPVSARSPKPAFAARAGQNHGLALPFPAPARPEPAARPLAVAAARPLAAPRPEPVADARQDRRRHGRARHGHGLPLERPRLRVHQAGAFYRVLYSKGV